MPKRKNDLNHKNLLLLFISLGLIGCKEPNYNTPETDRERISNFNKRYEPESKILNNNVYVDWKANKEERLEPLKLKTPLEYLDRVIDKNGRIGRFTSAFIFKELEKDNKYMIYQINFKLLRSGQPVDAKYFGKLTDTMHDEVPGKMLSTLKKIITGQPPGRRVDTKAEKLWDEYYKNIYEIQFSNGSGGEYALKMNDTQRYYRSGTGELVKVKNENGLDLYQTYHCHDPNELKQTVKEKSMGYGSAQNILDALQNKPLEDRSPKDCLSESRYEFWISPEKTSAKDAVGIMCWQLGGCSINFLYKNRHVEVFPLLSVEETLAQWKDYRKKAEDLLEKFERDAYS